MHRTTFRSIAVLAAFVFAALAFAQSADKNTAGPTANTLQLRLTEPAEGSTITGDQVRVTVNYNKTGFGQGQGTKFGEPNFPHPIFDVFLDNDLKASLKGGESNVANIENVPPGAHKVVVMAKNISGEVIDRKEVAFTSVPAVAVEVAPAPAPPPPAAPIERSETVTSAPPPAPPAAAPAPEPATDTTPDELPATGSSHPRAALLGLALICAGLLFARKAR
jgi:LPXTG-motif cell wall-anchored protein